MAPGFPSLDLSVLAAGPPAAAGGPPPGVGGAGGPPTLPPSVLAEQRNGEATKLWAIGAFCIFGWEYLICLPKEYERIWKRPLNASAWLYIANRYFGILQLCFVVTLVVDIWSPGACKHMYLWEPVGALISTVLSQMILGYRVYAIFSQNKAIAGILGLTLLVEIVIGGFSISTTSPPPPSPMPAGMRPPCGAVMGPFGWLLAFWVMPLVYDTLTFGLTAWKAYEFWKREVNTPLFKIIWRDGLLYFFAIFGMNLANVIIFLTVQKSLRAVNLTPTLVFEVVLSCRLLLNLRGVGRNRVHAAPAWVAGGSSSGGTAHKHSGSESKGGSADATYVVSSYSSGDAGVESYPMKARLEPVRADGGGNKVVPHQGGIDVKIVKSTWADR